MEAFSPSAVCRRSAGPSIKAFVLKTCQLTAVKTMNPARIYNVSRCSAGYGVNSILIVVSVAWMSRVPSIRGGISYRTLAPDLLVSEQGTDDRVLFNGMTRRKYRIKILHHCQRGRWNSHQNHLKRKCCGLHPVRRRKEITQEENRGVYRVKLNFASSTGRNFEAIATS